MIQNNYLLIGIYFHIRTQTSDINARRLRKFISLDWLNILQILWFRNKKPANLWVIANRKMMDNILKYVYLLVYFPISIFQPAFRIYVFVQYEIRPNTYVRSPSSNIIAPLIL